jgi:hypothetical protein
MVDTAARYRSGRLCDDFAHVLEFALWVVLRRVRFKADAFSRP